jgi:hypothetical protein
MGTMNRLGYDDRDCRRPLRGRNPWHLSRPGRGILLGGKRPAGAAPSDGLAYR